MRARKLRLDGLAVVAIVVCCVLWGLNQVAAKAALAEVPALWQLVARSVGAGLLVLLWARFRGIAIFERDGTLAGGLLAGGCFAIEFACIFFGLRYTSASRMVVFIYVSPFIVALGMPFIAKAERLSRWQAFGLVLAFAGVASAFAEGFTHASAVASPSTSTPWIGDALGLAGGIFWGATTLAIRGTALSRAAAEKTLLYQLLVSGLVLGIAALVTGVPLPTQLSTLAWVSLAFQIVIVTFASYLVWFWLLRNYPATQISAFTLLTPIFGLIFGVLLLHEAFTARLLVALATVAVGIVLVNRQRALPM